jgi:hypothetical protein
MGQGDPGDQHQGGLTRLSPSNIAPVFSVDALREARRLREDGRTLNQVFITILQKETMEHQGQEHTVRSGYQLVLDLDETRVMYVISKGRAPASVSRLIKFKEERSGYASLAATYFGDSQEPFAALHHLGA